MQKTWSVRRTVIVAVLMAMNVALSSFSIPVPGGHLYFNDVVIVAAALLLSPSEAFVVGGVGAFLGDFLFYPAPMFVSLFSHGLEAVIISSFARKAAGDHKKVAAGIFLGAAVMVTGYTLGRAFVYATPAISLVKFPFECLQAGVGAVLGYSLVYRCGIERQFQHRLH
ncbi:hypothetical protein lacNasYZ03_02920 [Lactobacillus nasalidis]|uniref:ECF transporter S component n=1 Tax=Lactobacillus nasalidis TaxID=2797258 RepID=A0ABQ3W2R3_9LACO|nr:ECF transporter S component [Lactobacillus nasalidis]GHV97030.1 hypothetical protein lacNasYZ01_02120 [Lactobacillus nasalidis]GHV99443.1 hypothetical protein lacNasYZ02_08730 [Lactobacillus nasalidis]GHW00605.1 hypothetical protein lacNasYZ03_02920 [Lactobacillus nasalidis]